MAELVEGATLLLAAAVLLFVSSWLLGQREARQWKDRLQQKARAAFSERGLIALFAVGFLAVFREGAETVLFLFALAAGEGAAWLPITTGGGVALAVLLAAFYAVRAFGLRLPLRAFFTVTAWSLLALAVIYVGRGVHAMQEVGLVTETALAGLPKVRALGLYPYVETLAAQAVTLLLGLFLNLRITQAKRAGAPAAE
jgi:high-affinity iron transporter